MAVKIREREGAWWLVIDWKGRRKSKRVGVGKEGKKAAQAAAERIQAKLALGDLSPLEDAPPPKIVEPPRFAALAAEWLERYPLVRGIRPNTLANYQSFTRHHLLPFFGEKRVTEISPDVVEDFIAAKLSPATGSTRFQGKALTRGSLRIGLVALRLILQRAVKPDLLPANPVTGLGRFPRIDEDRADPFTSAELHALLAAAQRLDPDFAALLRLWAQTGLRAGEVCGLQWQDLDLERGVLVVRRTWSRGRLGPTKTGQARGVSLLHPTLDESPEWRPGSTPGSWAVADALRRLRVRSLVPEAFIFARGSRPLRSFELHQEWRRVVTAAGVRYRAPEQLRHTFASTMLSRNAPLLYVQKQGGWRSAAVLLRVYARWLPPDAEAVPRQPAATPAQPGIASTAGMRG